MSRSRRLLGFAIVCLLGSTGPAHALIYTYDNTTSGAFDNTTAPCTNPLTRTFTVSDSFTVAEIALGLNITHTYRGDIRATLVAPNSTTLQVVTESGSDGSDNYDIFISSNADGGTGPLLNDGDLDPVAEPYYNRLVRLNAITFYTGNSAGTWTLRICDTFTGDSGTFNRAQLMLRDTTTTSTSCASRMTYDWGSNGNNATFSSTTVNNTTLTQSATVDYGGAGFNNTTLPRYNLRTGTGTFSSHTGYYGFYMDAATFVGSGADSETIMERVSFTYSPPARDLSFSLMDNDFASGDFEDMMRVTGLDASGVMVPYTITPGTVHQLAGVWVEGDSASDETAGSTSGSATYSFEGPVSTLHIDYGQGDQPASGAGDQWLFLSDFSFCSFDYGDAPATFGSARHVLGSRGLYLGSARPDGETTDQPNSSATGDDSTSSPAVDDENSVASFPTYTYMSTTYTVSVNAVNTSTTTAASLVGYIDWNSDGDFADAGERSATVSVPANTGTPSAFNVTWSSVPAGTVRSLANYARFRLAYTASEAESPTGLANSGEVEDFEIPVNTLPVTVAYFQSSARGAEWITASETGNIGFRLLGRGEKGPEIELGRRASDVVDSQAPTNYRLDVPIPAGIRQLWLEEIDTRGKTRRHGPFAPGQVFGALPETPEIDWAAIRTELASGARPRASRGSFAGALIEVEKPGIQRIPHAALLAAGIDLTGVAASQLAVLDAGQPVARAILGGPTWNAASAIELYFEPRLSLWSPVDVLELRLDPAKARAPKVLTAPSSGVAGITVASRLEASPNRAYSYASPNGDPFFDQRILAYGAPAKIDRYFDLPDFVPGGAKIELKLWGVTNWPEGGDDHHVVVRLNGREIADARFDGLAEWTKTLDDPGFLRATGNHLEVELPFDTGFAFDLVHFEGFTVHHRREAKTIGGRLEGALTSRTPATVSGLAGDAALWADGGRVLLRPVGGKVVLPVLNGNFSLAEAAAQHQPRVVAGIPAAAKPVQGNYLVISHPAFADGLADLLTLQGARGHQPSVVTTEAIYAAYSDHVPDPRALQRYVASLGRELQYVLLVGAESYDPYDYLGRGSISFVPAFYQRVNEFVAFGPTDELIVDRNGDQIPDLPIGRLPVRSQAELDAVIAKMWAWENGLPPREALVSSGLSGNPALRELAAINGSFDQALGGDWLTTVATVDQEGTAAVRASVLDAFAQGVPLISFVGHSAFGQWDFTPILRWQDVATLGYGGRPSVVLQWGCWNGYYASPEYDTLSNHLLLQPLVGAVATVGSSTLTSTAAHQGLGSRFLARVAAGDATVGQALLAAKRELYAADPNTLDAVWGQILLGDPATPLP